MDSPFGTDTLQTPAGLAAPLAAPAAAGHFDELRGRVSAIATKPEAINIELTPAWGQFFEQLGPDGLTGLDRRGANLQRRSGGNGNGISDSAHAEAGGAQAGASLALFPLIITAQSWQQIEAGVLQRARVLERVMADVYGPQQLLASGLLPSALVQGHPGYLRALHGVAPVGGTHLHIAAFDLARGPDGNWWVVSQRTQAPPGLGRLLANRRSISRLFPQAFEALHVQRLAASYRVLVDGLKRMSAAGANSHIALLTPGPYNEAYSEHACLARYLGLSLVEGSDLTVRDQRLYLRTLRGLEPVHALLTYLDDEFLDPLELRADSRLGVPGLLQAMRAGHLLVANAPGSGFLESPALLGFLPAISQHLLGETLALPALPTWWCGECAARQDALARLSERFIKPTYPASPWGPASFAAVRGRALAQAGLDEWALRIAQDGDAYTVQDELALSQLPTWGGGERTSPRIVPRPATLRVFAIRDGAQSWRVLPGGLTRIAAAGEPGLAMQRGGSSADTWVLGRGPGDMDHAPPLPQTPDPAAPLFQRKPPVTRRAAENLYWLGRYTERCQNIVRLARLTLDCLRADEGDDPASPPLWMWLGDLAVRNALVPPGVPAASLAPREFERSLIAALDGSASAGVGFTLRAIKLAAFAVRERLSQAQWNTIVRAGQEFAPRGATAVPPGSNAAAHASHLLDAAGARLAAMAGAQDDQMARDDGWRLLCIGRSLERLGFLAASLAHGLETGAVHEGGGVEAMTRLCGSTQALHGRHPHGRDVAALLEGLVLDQNDPRSVRAVAQALTQYLLELARSGPTPAVPLTLQVPDCGQWDVAQLCKVDEAGQHHRLMDLLQQCIRAARAAADGIEALYFTQLSAPEPVAGA